MPIAIPNLAYLAFHLVVIGSLVVSKVFYKEFVTPPWKMTLFQIGLAMTPFLILDSLVTGWFWWFNPSFILPLPTIFGLPIEEIGFFFVVSFALITLWYNMVAKTSLFQQKLLYASTLWKILGLVSALATVFSLSQDLWYTSLMVGWMAVSVLLTTWYDFVATKGFWLLLLLTLLLTSLFNMYLTSLPIVVYNTTIKSGVLVGTIPIEDFVFAALMLTNLMMVMYAFSPKPKNA